MKHSSNKNESQSTYQSNLSRRDSIKWLSALAACAALPSIVTAKEPEISAAATKGHWPELKLKLPPIKAAGYGKDPSLLTPAIWPKTLSDAELNLVAVLSDILVPKDGDVPSASEVNVPDVIDEWVSAPYEQQQADRLTILSTLKWIDDESALRFSKSFIQLTDAQQIEIIEDIAYLNESVPEKFLRIARAFNRLRQLVIAAFFCSPAGTKDLGYIGNTAIAGDYPGPTAEAMEHLNDVLKKLGLSL